MNKFLTITAAATLAVVTSLSAISPSKADPAGAAVAGGVLGFMAGAAAAGGLGPHYVYHDSDFYRFRGYGPRWGFRSDIAWRRHVQACFAAYPSYDPRTDTYIGRDRRPHRCMI